MPDSNPLSGHSGDTSSGQRAGADKPGSSEYFGNVAQEALAELGKSLDWQNFPSDHVLIDADSDRAHGVFLLSEGEVEIFRNHANGERKRLARLKPIDFFGEVGAMSGTPGSAGVVTTRPSLIAEIPSKEFLELTCRFPQIAVGTMRRLADYIRRADRELHQLNLAENLLERLLSKTQLWTL